MKIEISVKWEDGEGMEQELYATSNSFEGAEMELGSLERKFGKLEVEAERRAEDMEENIKESEE